MSQTSVNNVTLVGRLTRDCELRYTDGGMAICTFSIALNYSRKQGEQWVEEVNYFDMVIFGKRGDALGKYLTKGKQVGIEGELRQNRWEQEGKSRSKVEVVVRNLQFIGGDARNEHAPTSRTAPEPAAPSAAPPSGNTATNDSFEDDIPF